MNVKDSGSRVMRWRIQLAEYDYENVHKRGAQNVNDDGLSRIGCINKVEDRAGVPDKSKRRAQKNSVALVRERTIPTERPPPVGEVSANFCG